MHTLRNIRLFVDQKLKPASLLTLSGAQSHYLSNVMRCSCGEAIKCFNPDDGEFLCRITECKKNGVVILPEQNIRHPRPEPDIWLIFSPLKKDKTDFVIEKSVELGVSRIIPLITQRTNAAHIKTERFVLQAVEATEQCERLSIPTISSAQTLEELLSSWDEKRHICFMDERRAGQDILSAFRQLEGSPCAVLIGPEGGFTDSEAQLLNSQQYVTNINLGPRILRAETAATAALSVWQALNGDWQTAKEAL